MDGTWWRYLKSLAARIAQWLTGRSRQVAPAALEQPDLGADGAREFVVFLTPLDGRIRSAEFRAFLMALIYRHGRFLSGLHPWKGGVSQLACAVLPGGQLELDLQVLPEGRLSDGEESELFSLLHDLPRPGVTAPIAFVARACFGDGPGGGTDFEFPFKSRFPNGRSGPLEEQLLTLVESRGKTDPSPWNIGDFTRLIDLDSTNVAAVIGRAALYAAEGRADQALADYDRALELSPNDADILAERADYRIELEDFDRALADYGQALALDSKHIWSRYNRAMLYGKLDKPDLARADIEQGLCDAPDNPQLFLGRGLLRASSGDLAGAIGDFTSAVGLRSDFASAYLERAKAYMQQDEPERAMADLADAMLHAPVSGTACAMRAAILADLGRTDEAIADLTTALGREPHNPDYRVQRAHFYLSQAKNELALEELQIVQAEHPDQVVAWGLSGIAHQQLDEFPEAIADCSEAIDRGLMMPAVFFSRAVARHFTGETESALADLEQTLEMAPDHAAAYNARGLILAGELDFDAAEQDFSAAIEHSSDWAMPWLHRGNTHAARGEMRQAIHDYDQAIRLLPELALAFKNRGTARAELEDTEQAIADLAEAIRIDPEFVEARFERAMLQFRAEDFKAVREDLDEVLRLDEDNAAAYYWRANAWRASGNPQRAVEDLDALIRLCPTSGSAYSSRGSLWIEMGQPDRAAEDFAEAIRVEPGSAESFTLERLLAEAAHALNAEDFDQAIACAAEALEANAECAPAHHVRATAYWYSGQHVEAADDLTWLVESGHDSPEVRGSRGQVYAEMAQFEEALVDLDRSLAAKAGGPPSPGRAYALSGRALALTGLGRHDEAARDFEASVVICPGNAWVHYNQGVAYRELGDEAKALVCFGLAMNLTEPRLPPFKRRRAQQFLKLRAARVEQNAS